MRFGRVEAYAQQAASSLGVIRVTVVLDTGASLATVRDEDVPLLRPIDSPADVSWHADQYAQETIGTLLAEEGWEVIAADEAPPSETGQLARSRTYVVRRLS